MTKFAGHCSEKPEKRKYGFRLVRTVANRVSELEMIHSPEMVNLESRRS